MVWRKSKFLGIINLTGTDTLSKVTPEAQKEEVALKSHCFYERH